MELLYESGTPPCLLTYLDNNALVLACHPKYPETNKIILCLVRISLLPSLSLRRDSLALPDHRTCIPAVSRDDQLFLARLTIISNGASVSMIRVPSTAA